MNAASCPDELLVHARAGSLSQHDRRSLETHLEGCALCRAALQVGRDFDGLLGAQPGDDEIAARVAGGFMKRRSRAKRPVLVAAALVGSVAVAAATPQLRDVVHTAFFADSTRRLPEPTEADARSAPRSQLERARATADERVPGSTRPTTPAAAPAPETRVAPPAPVALPSAAAQPPRGSAAELFAEANARRSSGQVSEARRSYRELQQRYPGSKEALVSHVSLGRLEASNDPSAALRHFDAYLARAPGGALAEEALFGRATACESLGKRSEARATWQQLLQRFPSSIYAKRARARVAARP